MSRLSAAASSNEDDVEMMAPIPVLEPILRKERIEPDKDTIVRDFAYSFDDFLFWNFSPAHEARTSISASEASDELESRDAAMNEQAGFQGAPPWLQSAHDGGLSEEDPASQSHDDELHGRAVALFDFSPEHENEFPLSEGQVIYISSRHGLGWLVAVDMQSGDCGLVPEEYVRLLEEEDEDFVDATEPDKASGKHQPLHGHDSNTSGPHRSNNDNHGAGDEEWVDEPEEMETTTDKPRGPPVQETQKDPKDLTDAERQAIFDAAEREMRLNDARLRDS